jgi:hypothetical protein
VNDLLTGEIESDAQLVLEASMLLMGYRRRNYGKWRKKRANKH